MTDIFNNDLLNMICFMIKRYINSDKGIVEELASFSGKITNVVKKKRDTRKVNPD